MLRDKLDAITGLLAVLGSAAGSSSTLAALVTLLSGDFVTARACLMAALLSFGLLSNAVFFGPRLLSHES
jgi:hypothetical protein